MDETTKQAPGTCGCSNPEACLAPCAPFAPTEGGESADRPRAGDRPISRSVDERGRGNLHEPDCPGIGRPCCAGDLRSRVPDADPDDGPLEGQTTIEDALADRALTDLFGGGRFTESVRTAVAAALVPAARHLIEAKLEEETAAVELGALAGMWTGEAVLEARRRFAACGPSMTLAGAMRSVARDFKAGDWAP